MPDGGAYDVAGVVHHQLSYVVPIEVIEGIIDADGVSNSNRGDDVRDSDRQCEGKDECGTEATQEDS
jgi:hypothetical protein